MKQQQHIDKIKEIVIKHGIRKAVKLFGGNTYIFRETYKHNPESFLDYLIGNLKLHFSKFWDDIIYFKYNEVIILQCKKCHYNIQGMVGGTILVNDSIWDFFFRTVMLYDDIRIQMIMDSWLDKHLPSTSHLKPIPMTNPLNRIIDYTNNYVI